MNTFSIGLEDYKIPYKYSTRSKYIRLQVTGNDIVLIIPRNVKLDYALVFAKEKSDWIKKHLVQLKKKEEQYYFFGNKLVIDFEYDFFLKNIYFEFVKGKLKIRCPSQYGFTLKTLVTEWIKKGAKQYITTRTDELARKHGFTYKKVNIRNQRTRWGSCSAKRNLSFNYMIMQFEQRVIDYVIIHELCHTKVMNHSKDFWSLLQSIMPDYKFLRKKLKNNLIQ